MTIKYFNVKGGVQTGNIVLDAASGNVTGITNATLGNLVTANYFSGDGSLLSSITGANVTGQVGNALVAGTVYTNAQPNITSVGTLASLNVSANITSGNASLGNLVTANYFSGDGSRLSALAGANVTGQVGNALVAGTVYASSQPNITSVGTLASLTVTANVTAGNATLGNLVTANFFSGDGNQLGNLTGANVVGAVASATTATTATSATTAGTVTTAAQPNITSVGTLANLTVTANISAGNANLGNVATANYFTGTLTTAAQPNITSVGNLASLTVGSSSNIVLNSNGSATFGGNITSQYFVGNFSGNISGNLTSPGSNTEVIFNDSGEANATAGFTFNKSSNTVTVNGNITTNNAELGNLVTANFFSGTLDSLSGDQPNITTVGTLTDITTSGNAVIAGNLIVSGTTTYVNTTNTQIEDPLLTLGNGANGAALTSDDSKDRGLVLDYYTGGAPVSAYIGWKNANAEFEIASNASVSSSVVTVNHYANIRAGYFIGNGSALASLTGANVTGQVGNALVAGTVYTAAQPNITSTGTLSSVTVSGTTNLGAVGNVTITGGTNGQYLQTNGSGALTWQTISTSSISNGNSNVSVAANANVTISSAGNANIVTVTGTGVNVAGTLNATGNVIAQSKLLVGLTSSSLTNPVAVFSGSGASYDQVAVINSTGTGSADVAVYGNNGDDTQSWSDIGFTGNSFSDANYTVTAAGDGYFFVQGNTSFGGNMVLATGEKGTTGDIIFATGGFLTGNIKARLYGANGAFKVNANILAGNANLGNLVTSNYFKGDGGLLSNITGANVTGFVANATAATTAGTVTTAAQPNITSTGTLASLTVTANISSGNANLGNLVTASYFSGDGSLLTGLTGANVTGQVGNALIAGTVYTGAQPNITSTGTLVSLTVTGNISAGNANLGNLVTSNYFKGDGGLLSNITGANVVGAVPSATTAGTVTTAYQPNITGVGTLTSLAVTGNVTAGNVKINGGLLSNRSNVTVTSTDTIIDQFPTSSFRSAKYYITGKGTNGYQSAEILLVQDGTNSYITIFGSICSNSTADLLNFSSNVDGTSGNVRIYANTVSTGTTVNLIPIYLND